MPQENEVQQAQADLEAAQRAYDTAARELEIAIEDPLWAQAHQSSGNPLDAVSTYRQRERQARDALEKARKHLDDIRERQVNPPAVQRPQEDTAAGPVSGVPHAEVAPSPPIAPPADGIPRTYSPPPAPAEKTGNDQVDSTVGARDPVQEQAEIEYKRGLADDRYAADDPDAFYHPPVSLITPEVDADGELKYKPPPAVVHASVRFQKDDPFVWQYLDALWDDFSSGDAEDRLGVFFQNIPTGIKQGAQGLVASIETAISGWSHMTWEQFQSLPDATKEAYAEVSKAINDLLSSATDADGGKKFAAKVGQLTGNAMFQAALAKVSAAIGEKVIGKFSGSSGASADAGTASEGNVATAEVKPPAAPVEEPAPINPNKTARVDPKDFAHDSGEGLGFGEKMRKAHAGINDPSDPAINPITEQPMVEEPGVDDGAIPDETPDYQQVSEYAKQYPELEPDLDAHAVETRGRNFDKLVEKGMTPEEQAHYTSVRNADIEKLRNMGPDYWDAIKDPETRAYLEQLRDTAPTQPVAPPAAASGTPAPPAPRSTPTVKPKVVAGIAAGVLAVGIVVGVALATGGNSGHKVAVTIPTTLPVAPPAGGPAAPAATTLPKSHAYNAAAFGANVKLVASRGVLWPATITNPLAEIGLSYFTQLDPRLAGSPFTDGCYEQVNQDGAVSGATPPEFAIATLVHAEFPTDASAAGFFAKLSADMQAHLLGPASQFRSVPGSHPAFTVTVEPGGRPKLVFTGYLSADHAVLGFGSASSPSADAAGFAAKLQAAVVAIAAEV